MKENLEQCIIAMGQIKNKTEPLTKYEPEETTYPETGYYNSSCCVSNESTLINREFSTAFIADESEVSIPQLPKFKKPLSDLRG
jgi:hypothetical protein